MKQPSEPCEPMLTSELLVLPDGRILVHNLTPAFAKLLSDLNPEDEQMRSRIMQHASCIQPNEL
jgi:hypothetical protein